MTTGGSDIHEAPDLVRRPEEEEQYCRLVGEIQFNPVR